MATDYQPKIGRIPIRHLTPMQPENLWAAKSYVGEVVPFEATVFMEGHDVLAVELVLTGPDGTTTTTRMQPLAAGTDRWRAEALIDRPGLWTWFVSAWRDDYATWEHDAMIKVPANIDAQLMLSIGERELRRALTHAPESAALAEALRVVGDPERDPMERLEAATSAEVRAVFDAGPAAASLHTTSSPQPLRVERARAAVGSWYEFFPRSVGARQLKNGNWKSGTFRTAAKRLPEIAAMGFDVVYLPPIHPIGVSFRKGPNNTLHAGPGDPGSPWAIGSADGGHDAIHPDLGTEADFVAFVQRAAKCGLEVALDLALQCSPDHPWVREHPEWFTTLPDGSIAYAENPPKKYQDIYPLNFDNDPEGLRAEVLRVVRHWLGMGVRIFRVDNPHTKPLPFWEWLLAVVAAEHPDVVFLAEAFTRPAMLRSLAQAGFHQSYTYYTWRNTKEELEEYLQELSHDTADYLRPNLFVNTPDILTEYLQFGGPAAFKIRAAIAATASPSWGVYSGYELFEDVARPGSEENIDNEKYQYVPRDFAQALQEGRSLEPYLTKLNQLRKRHPALGQLRNLRVHWSEDESILVYSKTLGAAHNPQAVDDTILVVANVDPHAVRETTVHLDLAALGLDDGERFTVNDLVTGQSYEWGEHNYVRLDPYGEPVHIFHVQRGTADATAPTAAQGAGGAA